MADTDDYETDRSDSGNSEPDDGRWELTDHIGDLFDDREGLKGRTLTAVETRLRTRSVTSTFVDLLGVGMATAAVLFNDRPFDDAQMNGEV